MSDNESNSRNNQNNIKVKKIYMSKKFKYDEERKNVFKKMKQYIKYDEDKCTFLSENIDKNKIKNEIYDNAKKYFGCKVWSNVTIDSIKGVMTLIRNIFKFNSFELMSKNVYKKDDDGNKIITKRYVAVEIK